MPHPIVDITPPPESQVEAQADLQPKAPLVLEEPIAGGRYLRDPLTGALTPNPD